MRVTCKLLCNFLLNDNQLLLIFHMQILDEKEYFHFGEFLRLNKMRENNTKLWKMWQMIVGIVRQFCHIIRVLVS